MVVVSHVISGFPAVVTAAPETGAPLNAYPCARL